MWNNYTFIAELVGTFVLAFGVSGILLATRLKSFTLKGTAAHIFTAAGIALSLLAAVAVGGVFADAGKATWAAHTHGWVNPAVAIMALVGNAGDSAVANDVLPGIVGEIIGAIVAVGLVCLASKLVNEPKVVSIEAKFEVKNSIIGEVLGSALFLGGVAVAVFYGGQHGSYVLAGLIVSVSILAAILGFGHKFALLLNPAVAIAMFISDTVASKAKNIKFNAANMGMSMATNLAVAASIGGVVYGLSQM